MKISKRQFRKELEKASGKRIKWVYKNDISQEIDFKLNTLNTKIITDGFISFHGKEYSGTSDNVLRCNVHKLKVKDASTIIIEKTQNNIESDGTVVILEIYGGYKTAQKLYLQYIKGE